VGYLLYGKVTGAIGRNRDLLKGGRCRGLALRGSTPAATDREN